MRNVLIRGEYRPARAPARTSHEQFVENVTAGRLTADELLAAYCRLVYAQTGSYVETARRLGLDRRTVKAQVSAAR